MMTKWPTPPCAARPADWDLDLGDLSGWLFALRTCVTDCPMLDACRAQRDRAYPQVNRGVTGNPQSVIWGGVAYSETGRVLKPEILRRMAATRRNALAARAKGEVGAGVGASSAL